jgi:endonuclease/exonuclease/phosphatase family metal-dependent hydrolase
MNKIWVILSLVTLLFFDLKSQDTIKVATYNLLRYGSNTNRNIDFKKVIDYINADIYITQELTNNSGVTNFLNNVLNKESDKYLSAKFYDDTDIDQALFYDKNKFEILSTSKIEGDPRNIIAYRLQHIQTEKIFFVFNLHMKASQGSSNQQRRYTQVQQLINYTQQMNEDHFYVVAGDFNIYSTNEPAYQKFFEITATGYGKFNDLINVEGSYRNEDYAIYHTQSPRTSQFGGGASGGMDDRFDYILFSDSLMQSNRTFVLKETYKAIGNDGNHYDKAINIAPNTAVTQEIANALHDASDHLPVVVDIVFSNEIVIPPVNNSPIGNDTIFSLDEYPDDNVFVGKVVANDPDGDELSFSIISGNDEGFFKINNNGEIRVEDGSTLSYLNYKEFILIIEASDGLLKENIQVIINIVELPPLSLENFINDKINIYPNPFFESIVIDSEEELEDIKIYDLKGKISYSTDKLLGDNIINFIDQSDGVYILSFRVNKEKVKIRIIKKGQ